MCASEASARDSYLNLRPAESLCVFLKSMGYSDKQFGVEIIHPVRVNSKGRE